MALVLGPRGSFDSLSSTSKCLVAPNHQLIKQPIGLRSQPGTEPESRHVLAGAKTPYATAIGEVRLMKEEDNQR